MEGVKGRKQTGYKWNDQPRWTKVTQGDWAERQSGGDGDREAESSAA